jgi:hypothetical protein
MPPLEQSETYSYSSRLPASVATTHTVSHTRRPGLATRSHMFAHGVPVYPYTLAASSSLA